MPHSVFDTVRLAAVKGRKADFDIGPNVGEVVGDASMVCIRLPGQVPDSATIERVPGTSMYGKCHIGSHGVLGSGLVRTRMQETCSGVLDAVLQLVRYCDVIRLR